MTDLAKYGLKKTTARVLARIWTTTAVKAVDPPLHLMEHLVDPQHTDAGNGTLVLTHRYTFVKFPYSVTFVAVARGLVIFMPDPEMSPLWCKEMAGFLESNPATNTWTLSRFSQRKIEGFSLKVETIATAPPGATNRCTLFSMCEAGPWNLYLLEEGFEFFRACLALPVQETT